MDEKSKAAAPADNVGKSGKKFENNDMGERPKGCLIGGFNKKSVKAALEGYKEMLKEMQENYNTQLHDISVEQRKTINECGILKRQLKDAIYKNKNASELQDQFDLLNAAVKEKDEKLRQLEEMLKSALDEGESLKREIPKLQLEKAVLKDENSALLKEKTTLEEQYKELKADYDRLAAAKDGGWENKMSKDRAKDFTGQLESITVYSEVLEQQQANLERQLESMKTISQEMSTIKKGFNICKEELKEYQKKYRSGVMKKSLEALIQED